MRLSFFLLCNSLQEKEVKSTQMAWDGKQTTATSTIKPQRSVLFLIRKDSLQSRSLQHEN